MLSGFGGKRALFQRKGDADGIELHHLHQHAAGRVDQAADVELAVPHATVDRRGDAGVVQGDITGFEPGFGLLQRGAGDVALHAGVVHVVTADGVAAAQTFKAGKLLLRLAQRGFSASHLSLRQTQGGARLGVVQLEQQVAFFHVLPVAEVDFGDRAFGTRAQLNGVDGFDAARDLALGGVGGLLHGGDTNGDGGSEYGLQGAGEEREQEWEFHGSTSALFLPSPRPSPQRGEGENRAAPSPQSIGRKPGGPLSP